jgi:hypothetical protein
MNVYTRPFRKEVYDKVDTPSKQAVIKYLTNTGHCIVSSEENYFADVVSQKNDITYFHEAERKAQWKYDWPVHWKEVRIPARKMRLIKKYEDSLDYLFFYVLNKTYDRAWKIKATQMTEDTIREASGPRYRIPEHETFYHIPFVDCELVEIK